MKFVSVLNENAAAVQAIATVDSFTITVVYVHQTSGLAAAPKMQAGAPDSQARAAYDSLELQKQEVELNRREWE